MSAAGDSVNPSIRQSFNPTKPVTVLWGGEKPQTLASRSALQAFFGMGEKPQTLGSWSALQVFFGMAKGHRPGKQVCATSLLWDSCELWTVDRFRSLVTHCFFEMHGLADLRIAGLSDWEIRTSQPAGHSVNPSIRQSLQSPSLFLGWVSGGRRGFRTGSSQGSGCQLGIKAGLGRCGCRDAGRQRMGSQAHLHQRLRVRQTGNGESVGLLVTLHRLASGFIPPAGGFLVQFSRLNQGFLDFLHALRLRAHGRAPARIVALRGLGVLGRL